MICTCGQNNHHYLSGNLNPEFKYFKHSPTDNPTLHHCENVEPHGGRFHPSGGPKHNPHPVCRETDSAASRGSKPRILSERHCDSRRTHLYDWFSLFLCRFKTPPTPLLCKIVHFFHVNSLTIARLAPFPCHCCPKTVRDQYCNSRPRGCSFSRRCKMVDTASRATGHGCQQLLQCERRVAREVVTATSGQHCSVCRNH